MGKLETTAFELNKEESLVLGLLSRALQREKENAHEIDFTGINWENFIRIARGHRVLSLLYDELEGREELTPILLNQVAADSRKATMQSYRLLFLCKYLCGKLKEADIPVAVLKGVATASYYPVPELRKSGDVDLLLLDQSKLKKACQVLEVAGCKVLEEQPSLHHVVLESSEGIEIELHTMLAEPFDNEKINHFLELCQKEVIETEIMGVTLPIFNTAYHAYELLLHMLQHFLRAGFGLKLLCDWVVFWNTPSTIEEREKYNKLIQQSGLKGFSDMISQVCVKYLGLAPQVEEWMKFEHKYPVEEFLEEIFDAEEFGKNSNARMVGLRDNNLWGYVWEFHHQMHLNFPRAGKVFLFWPLLWVITLIRFLYNNRKIRNVSAREVLKSAGKRSRLIGKMNLWKT